MGSLVIWRISCSIYRVTITGSEQVIVYGKEINPSTAYKTGYDDSLNGKPSDPAAIYGALADHYAKGYAAGLMKARADRATQAIGIRLAGKKYT
jgi:hypothetical protein